MNKFIHIGSTILSIDEIISVSSLTESEMDLDRKDKPVRKITGYKIIITLKNGSKSTHYFNPNESEDRDKLFMLISKKLEAVII